MKEIDIWYILCNKLEDINCRPYMVELPIRREITKRIEIEMLGNIGLIHYRNVVIGPLSSPFGGWG